MDICFFGLINSSFCTLLQPSYKDEFNASFNEKIGPKFMYAYCIHKFLIIFRKPV